MKLFLFVGILFLGIPSSSAAIKLITDIIQFNLVGIPVLHKSVEWPFDPEIGARRARQYQEVNGELGEKLIERLGLGVDGYDRERLVQQQARDNGHLNGIEYLTP